MEVFLTENAFLGLLVSTIEVYRRECFGILLGHTSPERVTVEYVVPYQTARRKFQEVHMDWKRSDRIEEAVRTVSRWECVGDYHSHPMYGDARGTTKLSKTDRGSFPANNLSLVVAINDCARSHRWNYVKEQMLSGSINGYSIRIGAYYKDGEVINRAALVSPYAVGFSPKPNGKNGRHSKGS
jgi:proteasome lid subunit RPN8/RPN11